MVINDPLLNELLIGHGTGQDEVFDDYVEHIVNDSLVRYRPIIQTGKKHGESLAAHVLNGIGVLQTLRPWLNLINDEARVLYTAFTIHDINKVLNTGESFSKQATPDNLAEEIGRLGLERFLPEWERYLTDITTLVRSHPAHHSVGLEGLIVKRAPQYALGLDRVNALVYLMRAADVIDLSRTLHERTHKQDFLSHLNTYFADSEIDRQVEFHTHQIVEQRGLLSNVIHNALIDGFHRRDGWLPLLLYPDGVAYLSSKGTENPFDSERLIAAAQQVTTSINTLTRGNAENLIEQTNQGIKFKPDALLSGLPFEAFWLHVRNLIARRRFKYDDLEVNARKRLGKRVEKLRSRGDPNAEFLAERLQDTTPFIRATEAQMRTAEMARTYFILLADYAEAVSDPWERVYTLLDLPAEQHEFYNHFDERYDRAYVLAGDIVVAEDEAAERIIADGQTLFQAQATPSDADNLWRTYLECYLLIDGRPVTASASRTWADHLAQYVANQHQQCVHCAGPFATQEWMSGDVRDDIRVQVFSNRLLAGTGKEPKKYICDVCRIQFMLEALNYPRVVGEDTFYLHLFPYSYMTAPYLNSLRTTFARIREQPLPVQALNMDMASLQAFIAEEYPTRLNYRVQTKKGTPQPYGVYVPQYSDTVAGLIILPVNPAGDNDTERYLFALWNALALQRFFGVKVLLSKNPVPPLEASALPDVFLDMIPLSCNGLLPQNGYLEYEDDSDRPGFLQTLRQTAAHLFALKPILSFREDHTPTIIRAMTDGPLHIFHAADRILEKEEQPWQAGQHAFEHLKVLALHIGGTRMAQLSDVLHNLAQLAWEGRLRGSSLKRSSLLFPVTEVFTKMTVIGGEHDRAVIMAATVQDMYEHLERIADANYKPVPGGSIWQAAQQFVEAWYADLLDDIYGGSYQKLLRDQKLISSAYLFYVQSLIPRKSSTTSQQ
jgi:CRISPR-associated protein Csc3